MTEVSTRPHVGATKAPARAKVAPAPAPAPATVQPSETDTLVRQALKILQYVVTDIHESNIGAIADAEACAASDVAFLIAYPEECDSLPPSTLDGLAEVRQRLNVVFQILKGSETKTLPGAISACALVLFADQYAQRLENAVTGLPSTLEDLRALTTFTGARPHHDQPIPPIPPIRTGYSAAQMRAILEFVAGTADTLNNILMMAQTSEEVWERARLVNAAQLIALQIGAAADDGAGITVIGNSARWNYGPNFSSMAGAA